MSDAPETKPKHPLVITLADGTIWLPDIEEERAKYEVRQAEEKKKNA